MDIFERIFQTSANILKRNRLSRLIEKGASYEDQYLSISVLARAAAGDAPLELRGVDVEGFLQGDVLALPMNISRFSTPELNTFSLLHQALFGGALRALETEGKPASDYSVVIDFLSCQFPGFLAWHDAILKKIFLECENSKEDIQRNWLAVAWRPSLKKGLRALEGAERQRSKDPTQSELEAKRPGQVECIDLDEKKAENNPVMHSFEKMETADEYRGGHRVSDASDDLDAHASALDELNLNQVTRSGEGAQSVYRAEAANLLESEETALTAPRQDKFIWYPEWDYKKRELKPKHCRLYATSSLGRSELGNWKMALAEEHSSEIARWEQQWFGIRNQRAWKNRQWDGDQLDIDSFVRYQADLRSYGCGDGRVFARRLPKSREISTIILLDQSFSTDSFVDGRRVLDVELDSIGLAGLIFEKLGEQVAIAGTWSETRSHCHYQSYKRFDEPWSVFFSTAPHIEPAGYTRLGPAIRHAAYGLRNTGSKTKLLILLTDGKPTDYDRYEGRYGIEDIHHAFLEASQQGVAVKALAVEKGAQHYFPALFGARNYQILASPRQLPEALFRLYLEASMI